MASTTEQTEQQQFMSKNVTNLRELFKSAQYASIAPVKILENVGEHAFVVKFQPFEAHDLKMTLQIPTDCQLESSRLIITSKTHDAEKVATLKAKLEEILSSYQKSEQILVNFHNKASKLIEANFATAAAASDKATTPKPVAAKKSTLDRSSSPAVVKSKTTEEKVLRTASPKKIKDTESEKKCSMKTAADVVNRIQWDEQINKDFITVGYLDRFLGIKECAFNTFDWGDIVLADLGALAIPEHRINYFKYKNVTVWDKNTRLDNFFGSTGSNQTIHDIVEKMKDLDFNAAEVAAAGDEEEAGGSKKSKKLFSNQETTEAAKIGPNYFVSIPVTTSQVIRNLEDLKYELADYDPRAEDMLVPETSNHLTLCTLYAGSPVELETAKQALTELSEDSEFMSAHFPVSVKFAGIGDFYDKVLYVNCVSEEMDKLADMKRAIEEKLRAAGVNMAGNHYDFVPHLTVLKIASKQFKHLNVSHLVSREVRQKYADFNFGTSSVERVDLCKMVNIFDCKIYPVECTIRWSGNN